MGSKVTRSRSGLFVVALCFLTIVADGYDLIVFGASLPSLLAEPGWGLTTGTAGAIGSWTLAGMMLGYLLSGPLTDRLGRRKLMMVGIAWFSIGSGLCAFATSPEMLGVIRFLTGIGLAGVVPSAIALTVEYAPRDRRQLYNGLMLSGYSVGGIVAALVAMSLLPDHSWRLLYALAASFLVVLPVMYFTLPESVHYLVAQDRLDEARTLAVRYGLDFDGIVVEHRQAKAVAAQRPQRGYRLVFASYFRVAAVLFVVVSLCGHLLMYGLNTWLPHLMREAGYPLGSSLQFLLVMLLGAIVGMIGGSVLADRLTAKRVVVPFFLVGGLSLLTLSNDVGFGVLMIAVAGAGLGTVGTQVVVNGYIASYFPAECRASALGAALGLGRIGAIAGPLLGGWILAWGWGFQWNFYVFAIVAVAAAIVVGLIPKATVPPAVAAEPDPVAGNSENVR